MLCAVIIEFLCIAFISCDYGSGLLGAEQEEFFFDEKISSHSQQHNTDNTKDDPSNFDEYSFSFIQKLPQLFQRRCLCFTVTRFYVGVTKQQVGQIFACSRFTAIGFYIERHDIQRNSTFSATLNRLKASF